LPFLGLAFGLGAPLRPAERRGAGIEAVLASKLMLYWTCDDRVVRHPALPFTLHKLYLRSQALQQGGFLVAQLLAEAQLTAQDLGQRNDAGDDSIGRAIINHGANLINTDPYWRENKRELDARNAFAHLEHGATPPWFVTTSQAEYHSEPLHRILREHLRRVRGEDAAQRFDPDVTFQRKAILDLGHLNTTYFEVRCVNWMGSIVAELLGVTETWFRFDFAKSRGMIHLHSVLQSYSTHQVIARLFVQAWDHILPIMLERGGADGEPVTEQQIQEAYNDEVAVRLHDYLQETGAAGGLEACPGFHSRLPLGAASAAAALAGASGSQPSSSAVFHLGEAGYGAGNEAGMGDALMDGANDDSA
jgi:hypothetical protein